MARDIDLAFGDQRGCEIEHDGRGAFARNADAERRRRQPTLQPAERRDEDRPGGVDEMDRDQARCGGALRPFADPADMAGIAQRNCGEARCFRFFNADVDRHRRHRLAEAEAAVDDADHRSIDHTFDRLVGNEIACADPIDVTRHANDAMAVVASQIGVDKRGGDVARLLGWQPTRAKISAQKSVSGSAGI